MEWRIQGRNLEINDQIRSHIEEKLGQLSKRLPGVSTVSVELSAESTRSRRDRYVAQVTLNVGGSILRAEQRGTNTKTAINSAAEILSRRIERYKTQVYRSERARHTTPVGVQQAEQAAQDAIPAEATVLSEGDLVKTKRFEMKPMTVENAALQMQLLGHRFFMFLNSESDRHNVLYQRDDGDFGLIQPEE